MWYHVHYLAVSLFLFLVLIKQDTEDATLGISRADYFSVFEKGMHNGKLSILKKKKEGKLSLRFCIDVCCN